MSKILVSASGQMGKRTSGVFASPAGSLGPALVSLAQPIQGFSAASAYSGTLSHATTAGSNLWLVVTAFSGSNVAISSSAPLLGGSTPVGTTKVLEQQSGYDGATTYIAIWKLPSVPGGQTSISVTVTNGTLSARVGIVALEVLNSTGTVDVNVPATSSGTAVSVSGGPTAHANEIIIAGLCAEAGVTAPPGSPWTSVGIGIATAVGYQLPNAIGSFTFAATQVSANEWVAGLISSQ